MLDSELHLVYEDGIIVNNLFQKRGSSASMPAFIGIAHPHQMAERSYKIANGTLVPANTEPSVWVTPAYAEQLVKVDKTHLYFNPESGIFPEDYHDDGTTVVLIEIESQSHEI